MDSRIKIRMNLFPIVTIQLHNLESGDAVDVDYQYIGGVEIVKGKTLVHQLSPFGTEIRRSFYVQETCGDVRMLIKEARLAFVSAMHNFKAFKSE